MVISKYASLLINIYDIEFIITFNYSRPSWILLFNKARVAVCRMPGWQRVGCLGGWVAACRMPGWQGGRVAGW